MRGPGSGRCASLSFYLLHERRHTMSFIQKNWPLILVAVRVRRDARVAAVQRRMSPMKEVGTLDGDAASSTATTPCCSTCASRRSSTAAGCRTPCTSRCPSSTGASASSRKHAARPVVAYCARGQRSRGAGDALAKAGFTDIYHLHGGLAAWQRRRAAAGEMRDDGQPVTMYSTARVPVLRAGRAAADVKGVTAIDKIRVDLEPARRAGDDGAHRAAHRPADLHRRRPRRRLRRPRRARPRGRARPAAGGRLADGEASVR